MPRLTQLEELLFPVEEHPVFVNVPTKSGERRLSVPDKKAIVNTQNYRVLGVVSRGYRLVTNREALKWAYECCSIAYPETKPGEWAVTTSDAPQTGGTALSISCTTQPGWISVLSLRRTSPTPLVRLSG